MNGRGKITVISIAGEHIDLSDKNVEVDEGDIIIVKGGETPLTLIPNFTWNLELSYGGEETEEEKAAQDDIAAGLDDEG